MTAANQNGLYTVVSTAGNCASAPSTPQSVTITGLAPARPVAALSVHPNPTFGALTLTLNGFEQAATVTLYDVTGRAVHTATLPADSAERRVPLDLSVLPVGQYQLRVVAADGAVLSCRVVRE